VGYRRPIAVGIAVLVVAGCGRPQLSSSAAVGAATHSTTNPGAAAASPGDFGSLQGVCHPAGVGGGGGGGGGATDQSSGATDQGVGGTTIRIATFSDVGFAGRPGLNQELFDAAQVFSSWCNAAGGINGRRIVVDYRDAAVFNYKQRMIESCAQDFMMVGGGAVFDSAGQDTRLSCLLPDVAGYVVEPPARGADLEVQSVPSPLNAEGVGLERLLTGKYPGSGSAVGFLTGNVASTVAVKDQEKEATVAIGMRTVYDELYNAAGETTWTPFVEAMKSKGVKGLIFVGEPADLAKVEQAMADTGWRPQWIAAGGNIYDPLLIQTGGPAISSTYVPVNFAPFEDASNAALRQYLAEFAKYKPSGKSHAVLGLAAWSAWLIFATSAEKCGTDLTRACVYDNARSVATWDAAGMGAPQAIAAQTASDCYAAVQATPTGFEVVDVHPNNGPFNCDPGNVVTLSGHYGTGAKLSDVGKSLTDLK
jgi:ABC-type branched-subunit amino acid transport system substrate-binding protein